MPINDPVSARQIPKPDFTINQAWSEYTDDEHAIWDELYRRQMTALKSRAVDDVFTGLNALDLGAGGIPDFARINEKLKPLTGWTIVAVPHLVPDEIFFDHLANRRFPAGRFIRDRAQMDYIQEPDVFHDVFGHVPMLAQPVFADYMQAYGQGGLRSLQYNCLKSLARLYWYTVEYGLIKTDAGLRIYGAGILSSFSECDFSLSSASPNRLEFDMKRIMKTEYKIDDFQQTYFVIDSFDALFDATRQDFEPLYKDLHAETERFAPKQILETDTVITLGTQSYPGSR